FAGVEGSKRDLQVPFVFSDATDPDNPVIRVRHEDRDEYLARAYLFWTPHPWLALKAEYSFEQLQSEGLLDQPKRLNTHRVPLGIGFFHPSGFSASLRAMYVNQDGKNFILQSGEIRSGEDDFWTVDAAINYRLPKRYGLITVGATNLFDHKFQFFDT